MIHGREGELARLREVVDAAASARGGAVVITGPPGIGKTELARALVDETLTAAWIAGTADDAGLAYADLHDLVVSLRDCIEDLPWPQQHALRWVLAEHDEEPRAPLVLAVATLGLLSAAGSKRPVLVVVDDAPWVDPASLGALTFAARRLDEEPVCMVFTVREGSAPVLDLQGFEVVELAGLAGGAVSRIVEDRTGSAAAQSVVDGLTERCGGNPLAVLETLGELDAEQLAGRRPLPDDVGMHGLQRILRGRLEALAPPERRAARLAACSRTGWTADIVAALVHFGPDHDPVSLLSALSRARVLHDQAGRVVFDHPLVREACRQGSTEELHACHAALAAVLRGADALWHRASATAGPNEGLAALLEEMAERLQASGAHLEAGQALDRAAQLSAPGSDRLRRTAAAGREYQAAGAWDLADDRYSWVVDGFSPAEAVEPFVSQVREARGIIRLWSGRPEEGRDLLLAEAQRVASSAPIDACRMVLQAMVSFIHQGRVDLAAMVAGRARELSEGIGGVIDAFARCYTGYYRMLTGSAEGEHELLDAARLFAEVGWERGVEVVGYEGVSYIGLMLVHAEAFREAEVLLDEVIAACRRSGEIAALPVALSHRADLNTRTGRFRAALIDADEALQYARVTRQPIHAAYAEMRQLMIEAMITSDPARTWQDLLTFYARVSEIGVMPVMGETGRAAGLLHLGAGDAATAAMVLRELAAGCKAASLRHPGGIPHLGDLAEALWRCDDREGAQRAIEELRTCSAGLSGRWHEAAIVRLEGLLDDDLERLESAVELHEGLGMPFERGRALLDYGRALRRHRQAVQSRGPLQDALGIFEELNAHMWAESVTAELRAARAKPLSRRPLGDKRADLTPQEERVARLVAAGATNREVAAELFIAPKTVENSLSRVYAKLGVRSRTELARALEQP